MDCSTPGLPVHSQLTEFTQTCPLSWWCHSTILSSVVPFSCFLSFPASGSFPMSWLFTSGGHSIGASASVLLMNIQSWFPLGFTGFISLQSKGLSRIFSNTTVKNKFKINYNSIISKSWKKESTWALLGHLLGICVTFPSNCQFSKVIVPFYTLILTNTWYHQHL